MEGLAAVTAAMQLVDYGLRMADSISALIERIRTAPQRFEQYAQQVDRLVLAAREIEQNPDLQTRVVCCYLTATLAEAKAAQHILDHFLIGSRKRRYWGVISGKSQRKILEHLDNLHHSVAELSLCIMSINTTLLKESAIKVVEVGARIALDHDSSNLILNPRQSTLKLEGEDMMADSKCDSGAGHTFEDIEIEDDFMPSLGNVTSGIGCSMNDPGHEYKDVRVRRTFGLHLGNTGSRARHRFKKLRMSNNQGTLMGDVDTLATKQGAIHLTQEAMKSMPDGEDDSAVSSDSTSTKSSTTLPE